MSTHARRMRQRRRILQVPALTMTTRAEHVLQVDQIQVPFDTAFDDKNVFQVKVLVDEPRISQAPSCGSNRRRRSTVSFWR